MHETNQFMDIWFLVQLRLKTDLVSYPAWAEGLVNIYNSWFINHKNIKMSVDLKLEYEKLSRFNLVERQCTEIKEI